MNAGSPAVFHDKVEAPPDRIELGFISIVWASAGGVAMLRTADSKTKGLCIRSHSSRNASA
jgi:hypothetical protein